MSILVDCSVNDRKQNRAAGKSNCLQPFFTKVVIVYRKHMVRIIKYACYIFKRDTMLAQI
jgi:hypothetical protein